jgi:hypothetical protein
MPTTKLQLYKSWIEKFVQRVIGVLLAQPARGAPVAQW